MKNKVLPLSIILLGSFALSGCNKATSSSISSASTSDPVAFTYDETEYEKTYGTNPDNTETHEYDSLKVKKTSKDLRKDFAMGVDGSMISKIEASGGQYYNKDGKNQDVFQILKENGVNFFRVRLWNSPENKFGRTYGGGENNIDTDIALAKRAKAVGMNVLLDFHYSDF